MKVRVTLDVDSRARYVIAKTLGVTNRRSTREQTRKFVRALMQAGVNEYGDLLPTRQRNVARRLDVEQEPGRPGLAVMKQQMKLI